MQREVGRGLGPRERKFNYALEMLRLTDLWLMQGNPPPAGGWVYFFQS